MSHRTSVEASVSPRGLLLAAGMIAGVLTACSSSSSSPTAAPSAAAETEVAAAQMTGAYQGTAGAPIVWFAFVSETSYELQPSSCTVASCYVAGTYTIGAGNTLELSDDGTGKPASLPLSDIQFASASQPLVGQSEEADELRAQGVGLVSGTQAPLVNSQVSSFVAGGNGYTLVASDSFGPGTCSGGTCKLTNSLISYGGSLLPGVAQLCSRTSWGSGCSLGYGCCHSGA